MITLHTNFGDIHLELDTENTPATAKNFLQYVETGFYDGTIFHRVIDNFMIQGGGFTSEMEQKEPFFPIENEAENAQPNTRGTVAMARTNDPHSATAQFFINVVDNDFLNFSGKTPQQWGYCVFAKVVDGMDIVDKIKQSSTTSKQGHQDVPVSPVIIEKATITESVQSS